jgi:hypothetical protein
MDSKPIYASKTLWTNVLAIAVLILAAPEFAAILPTEGLPYVAAAIAALNVILRFSTSTAVRL